MRSNLGLFERYVDKGAMATTGIGPKKYYGRFASLEAEMSKRFGDSTNSKGETVGQPLPIIAKEIIAEYQLQHIREQLMVNSNKNLIINQINNIFDNKQVDTDLSSYIVEIENIFSNIINSYDLTQENFSVKNKMSNKEKEFYQRYLNDLETVYHSLESYYKKLVDQGVLSVNDSDQLILLRNRLEAITNVVQQQRQGLMARLQIVNYSAKASYENGAWSKPLKDFEAKNAPGGFKAYLQREKGMFLEVAGTNKIKQGLPKNLHIVNMGNIKGPIFSVGGLEFGQAAQLTSDWGIFDFDKIADNISIELEINGTKQNMQLKKFIELLEKGSFNSEEIIILDKTYSDYMVGVQGKAGLNQSIFNKGKRTSISTSELQGDFFRDMIMAMDAAKKIRYLDTHEDYAALFNYDLAKNLTFLLGKDNAYVYTRNGFQYLPDYIRDHKLYFGIGEKTYSRNKGLAHKYQISQHSI